MVEGALLEPPSWRAVRPEEEGVNFASIEERIDREVDRFYREASAVLGRARDATIAKAVGVRGTEWAQMRELTLVGEVAPYRALLRTYLNDLYQFGRAGAGKELQQLAPVTSRAFQAWLETKTQNLVRLHTAVLESRAISSVLGAWEGERLSQEQATELLVPVFDAFSVLELPQGAEVLAAQAIGAGRADVIEHFKNTIRSVTWSAILDRRVCEFCRHLDGTTWEWGDPELLTPPLHPWCRCLLVPTLFSATYKPAITGMPRDIVIPDSTRRFLVIAGNYRVSRS